MSADAELISRCLDRISPQSDGCWRDRDDAVPGVEQRRRPVGRSVRRQCRVCVRFSKFAVLIADRLAS